jgi:hypothetical protein
MRIRESRKWPKDVLITGRMYKLYPFSWGTQCRSSRISCLIRLRRAALSKVFFGKRRGWIGKSKYHIVGNGRPNSLVGRASARSGSCAPCSDRDGTRKSFRPCSCTLSILRRDTGHNGTQLNWGQGTEGHLGYTLRSQCRVHRNNDHAQGLISGAPHPSDRLHGIVSMWSVL